MEVAQGGTVADKREQQAAAGQRGHLITQQNTTTQSYKIWLNVNLEATSNKMKTQASSL